MVSIVMKKVIVSSFLDSTIIKELAEAHLPSLPQGRIIFVLNNMFSIKKKTSKRYIIHTIKWN